MRNGLPVKGLYETALSRVELVRRELPEALARYESGETQHVGTLRVRH
jgi:hypothetical protein